MFDEVNELNFDGNTGEIINRGGPKRARAEKEPTLIGDLESGHEILRGLIAQFHTHLASVKVRLLCVNKSIKVGGRERPGKVQKTNPLTRFLTRDEETGDEADVLVMVSLPAWNPAPLEERTAMLDHLLSMIEATEDEDNGSIKLTIVSPQVQEFAEVIERRGLYNTDIQDLANVVQAL